MHLMSDRPLGKEIGENSWAWKTSYFSLVILFCLPKLGIDFFHPWPQIFPNLNKEIYLNLNIEVVFNE